jgi:hypothetical protein
MHQSCEEAGSVRRPRGVNSFVVFRVAYLAQEAKVASSCRAHELVAKNEFTKDGLAVGIGFPVM